MNFANFWCNVSAIKIGENVHPETIKMIKAGIEKTLPQQKPAKEPEVTE